MIPMPIMPIMPINLPVDSSSGTEIVYPHWVNVIACLGGVTAMLGILWMVTTVILMVITDGRIDLFEKPHRYSLALALFGLLIFMVALVLMMITGQEITE